MNEYVELYRPPKRFGWAVMVWRQNIDGRRQVQRGDGEWEDVVPNADVAPTFYLDDQVAEQLRDLLTGIKPVPQPDPAVVPILQAVVEDTRIVRDRLLALVELERADT